MSNLIHTEKGDIIELEKGNNGSTFVTINDKTPILLPKNDALKFAKALTQMANREQIPSDLAYILQDKLKPERK